MTIFDSLKFPNPDIFNSDELKIIPRDILKIWMRQCLERFPLGFDVELNSPHLNFSLLAHTVAVAMTQEVTSVSNSSDRIIILIYKKTLTDMLKNVLAEYDSEYTSKLPSQISNSDSEI